MRAFGGSNRRSGLLDDNCEIEIPLMLRGCSCGHERQTNRPEPEGIARLIFGETNVAEERETLVVDYLADG